MRTYRLLNLGFCAVTIAGLMNLQGCGKSNGDKEAPPPAAGGDKKEKAFALVSGDYELSNLQNLEDGCAKNPLDPARPITKVPFVVTNDNTGNVSIDMCSGNQTGVQGAIKGNHGILSVTHGRTLSVGDVTASYNQNCEVELTVTGDNTAQGHYKELQTERSAALRASNVDAPTCTTAFDFVLKKK